MSNNIETIKRRVDLHDFGNPTMGFIMDVRWLIAEVERLTKRCEEARPWIRILADATDHAESVRLLDDLDSQECERCELGRWLEKTP